MIGNECNKETDAAGEAPASDSHGDALIRVKGLRLFYGDTLALNRICIDIAKHSVLAFIGPSGCGKSTLLRCFNRMNDLIDGVRVEGSIFVQGQDILSPDIEITELRRKVGMVFQKSNPFPKSIYENVAFGLRIHGIKKRTELDRIVEQSLRAVALWDEVADRLHASALSLSGGQQQRLCIARAIAAEPEIILMDEPCSALDPVATGRIEELLHVLKKKFTIVIVTHNMQQAARVSDFTGFMLHGELVEYGETDALFQRPVDQRTEDYIRGRFG